MVDPSVTLTVTAKPTVSLTRQAKPAVLLTKDLKRPASMFVGGGTLPRPVGVEVVESVISPQGNGVMSLPTGLGSLDVVLSAQGNGAFLDLVSVGILASIVSVQGGGSMPAFGGSGDLGSVLSVQGGGSLPAPGGSGDLESVSSAQGSGAVPGPGGSGTLSGTTGGAPVPELVWWVFDAGTGSTVPDQSGNGYTANIAGPEWDAIGLRFDARGEAVGNVDSALVTALDTATAISISCWVKADILGHDKGFFSVRSGSFRNDDQVGIRFDTVGDAGGTEVIKTGINTLDGHARRESTSNAATTEWTNYIYTWESGQPLGLYINGVADVPTSAGAARSGNLSTIQGVFVGRAPRNAEPWYGLVYEVRIYNRVVTQTEAQAIYDASKGLFTKPTHRIEAESMTLTNMVVMADGTASGGNYVAVSPGTTGSASTALAIPTGIYDVIVSYYDENDGNSSATISVGANSTNLTLNEATGSAEVSYDSKIAKRVFTDLAVSTGDTFTWDVTLDGTEIGGFDYVEFIEK